MHLLSSLFVFNQFGDLERCSLRPGNVHSAEDGTVCSSPSWRDIRATSHPFAFYNKRGTCEQWIKEGKGAIKWTRLSCRTFAANSVRLQLHALAYNLGNFLRTLATPEPIKIGR